MYVPTPSGSSLTCHKENHQLSEHRCSIIDLASYTLYGYISWQRFIWLASGWHSTDNLLQAVIHYVDQTTQYLHRGFAALLFITAPLIRNTVRATTLLMLTPLSHLLLCLPSACIPHFMCDNICFCHWFYLCWRCCANWLTLMAERFPYAKGKATGIYYVRAVLRPLLFR